MYDILISCKEDDEIVKRISKYYNNLKNSKYLYEGIVILINMFNFLKSKDNFILKNQQFKSKILVFYDEITQDTEYENISQQLKNNFDSSYINLKNIE